MSQLGMDVEQSTHCEDGEVISYLSLEQAFSIHWSKTELFRLEESLLFPRQEIQADPSLEQVAQLEILFEHGWHILVASSL